MVNRRGLSAASFIGVIAFTGACAGSPTPGPTQTVTRTVTVSEPAPLPDSPSSDLPAPDSGAPSESATSAEVPLERRNVPLGLSDFFEPQSAWREDRRDVASERDLKGLSADLSSCGDAYAQTLELCLGNKFEALALKAGLSNKSESSNQTMVVEVRANGKQVEIQRIPFNKVQPLTISVVDVNALIFKAYLDDSNDDCGQLGSAEGVLWDIVLK